MQVNAGPTRVEMFLGPILGAACFGGLELAAGVRQGCPDTPPNAWCLLSEPMFDHPGRMITPDDLTTPERAEIIRRSIAMLSTGVDALNREEALLILGRLVELLQAERSRTGPQPAELLHRVHQPGTR